MQIELSKIQKTRIINVAGLDPVEVMTETIKPHSGKITITCFGSAWNAFWGGIGDMTVEQFFIECNNDYLIGKLSDIPSMIVDEDELQNGLKREVIRLRREQYLTRDAARELFDKADDVHDIHDDHELIVAVYGDDWWHCLPEKLNPKYEYLSRIVDAVKEAFRMMGAEGGE